MAQSTIPTPDEALAGMAKVGAPRVPMGNEAIQASYPSATETGNATLVPKNHSKSVDPSNPGSKGVRQNVQVNPRIGASYGVKSRYSFPVSEQAAATQANGRIVGTIVNRSRTNFDSGVGASY